MELAGFIDAVVREARQDDYRVETNRTGQSQIDFGNKKLHKGHLAKLYPAILRPGVNVARQIENVAVYYNSQRLHSTLGYTTPMNHEKNLNRVSGNG